MSDVKRLILGIVLVFVGLVAVLSGVGGILPWLGGALGLGGCYLIVRVLLYGHLQ